METIEESLKLWTDRVLKSKRKEMSPGEVSSMFQQQVNYRRKNSPVS